MGIVADEKYNERFEKIFWVPQLAMGQKYYDSAWVDRDGPESSTVIGVRSFVECVLKCDMKISCRGFKSHSEGYMTMCEMFLEHVESQTIFSDTFSWMKKCFDQNFTEVCSKCLIDNNPALVLNRRQAIIWTNADPMLTQWRIYAAQGGDELKLEIYILQYTKLCLLCYHVGDMGPYNGPQDLLLWYVPKDNWSGAAFVNRSTEIGVWISNYIHCFVWNANHPCPNCNGFAKPPMTLGHVWINISQTFVGVIT